MRETEGRHTNTITVLAADCEQHGRKNKQERNHREMRDKGKQTKLNQRKERDDQIIAKRMSESEI